MIRISIDISATRVWLHWRQKYKVAVKWVKDKILDCNAHHCICLWAELLFFLQVDAAAAACAVMLDHAKW